MKKRIINFLLAVSLLLTSALFLGSCSASKAPDLESVKEEFSNLIEESAEINKFLFGEGLPVYKRDGSEEEQSYYLTLGSQYDGYEYVSEESKYLTIEAMKEAAEKVYTGEYLESVYQMVFDGYADEISGVSVARYYESGEWLFQSMNYKPLIEGTRMYDYDTMKIVKPSNGEYVNVEVESELDGERLTITLAFSKTENGWRLDTPTY